MATETFRIELRPGATLSEDAIERAVLAQGQERGRSYRLRWGKGTVTNSLATLVQPFRAPLLSGGEIDFGRDRSRPALLVFWASWCEPCVAEAPHLEALYRRYGDRVTFASVSIDDASVNLRAIVDRLGVTYPVALDPDGKILRQYAKATSIPLTFVIADDGAIRLVQRNYVATDEKALESTLADLVSH